MIAQRGHPQPQGGTGSSHPPGPGRLCTRGCSATFKSNGGIADRRCLLVKCLPGVGYPHSTGLGLGEMRGGGGVGMGFLLKLRKAANISLFFFFFLNLICISSGLVHHHPDPARADGSSGSSR